MQRCSPQMSTCFLSTLLMLLDFKDSAVVCHILWISVPTFLRINCQLDILISQEESEDCVVDADCFGSARLEFSVCFFDSWWMVTETRDKRQQKQHLQKWTCDNRKRSIKWWELWCISVESANESFCDANTYTVKVAPEVHQLRYFIWASLKTTMKTFWMIL